MKYKNVKTGAVIETVGKISGGDWQEVITAAVKEGGEAALPKAVTTKTPAKSQAKPATKTAPKTKKK